MRYGAMYGPDVTFLGVDRCDLTEPASFAEADVVIVGAPYDGGTSHRPGTLCFRRAFRAGLGPFEAGASPLLRFERRVG